MEADEAEYDRRDTDQQLDQGLEHLLAKLGWISTAKMADPIAMGRAMAVESTMTENDVTISGRRRCRACRSPACYAGPTWYR